MRLSICCRSVSSSYKANEGFSGARLVREYSVQPLQLAPHILLPSLERTETATAKSKLSLTFEEKARGSPPRPWSCRPALLSYHSWRTETARSGWTNQCGQLAESAVRGRKHRDHAEEQGNFPNTEMWQMLWILAIPILVVWLFLFALCRAAGKPEPKLSRIPTRELRTTGELSTLSVSSGVSASLVDSPESVGAPTETAQRASGPVVKERVFPRSTYHNRVTTDGGCPQTLEASRQPRVRT